MGGPRASIVSVVSLFRRCWRPLALTDLAAKIVAVVLLTPLVAIQVRAALALSGRIVLAEPDLLLGTGLVGLGRAWRKRRQWVRTGGASCSGAPPAT